MKLALHACCAPCALEPVDALSADHDVVLVYANPNIHPLEEYERRRDTLLQWAHGSGIDVVELAYEPAAWVDAVGAVGTDPDRRCRACFALRLSMVARYAAGHGLEGVATTLTVSPYQDHEAIVEAGQRACAEERIRFVVTDYRDRYGAATRRSRELGMYRQNYCGCVISQVEAIRAREKRRADRAASREREVTG